MTHRGLSLWKEPHSTPTLAHQQKGGSPRLGSYVFFPTQEWGEGKRTPGERLPLSCPAQGSLGLGPQVAQEGAEGGLLRRKLKVQAASLLLQGF